MSELTLQPKQPHLSADFLRAMQDELDANIPKGDWDELKLDRDNCKALIDEHVIKLKCAITVAGDRPEEMQAIREYAADLANIAMKIDQLFGPPRDRDNPDLVRLLPKPKQHETKTRQP